jgi:hypothetical protein
VIRQDFLQLLLTAAYKTLAQCLLEDIRLFMSVEAYEGDTNLKVVQTEQIKIILAPLGLRCVAFGKAACPGKK